MPMSGNETEKYGNVEGFIYQKDGKTPIPNALVILKNLKTKKQSQTAANDLGVYSFKNLPCNVYMVELKVGNVVYRVQEPLLLDEDSTRVVSFSLLTTDRGKRFLNSPLGIAVQTAGTTAASIAGLNLLTQEDPFDPIISPVIK
jgi:hypothetical protein